MKPEIAKGQPAWVCWECGDKYRAGKWFVCSTWHTDECDVCKTIKPVTQPRDCGYLRKGWDQK